MVGKEFVTGAWTARAGKGIGSGTRPGRDHLPQVLVEDLAEIDHLRRRSGLTRRTDSVRDQGRERKVCEADGGKCARCWRC